ncbi:hypothetical protein MIMGU_mgv1a018734mg [Erythranthe guttata]|uniref:Uncharacterized protein n=1 Tax=Erythranthe guttata TaxID=4155 RepID=A0A022RU70_ERYGU|nr:hypothetical protein MIMGU_mgv1a018734mg [Erythranthe guttata]
MDFSKIFGFLIILKETLKIFSKNGKFVASIAILSLLLSSIVFALFTYFLQFIVANMFASYTYPEYSDANDNNSHMLKYTALLIAFELFFLFIFIIIYDLSSTATILVSSFSYTGKKLNSKELFSSIKRTWKKPFSRISYSPSSRLLLFAFILVVNFYSTLLLALELSFLIIYNIISHLSSTATILVSAFSYTDHKNLTCKDLFSSIKQRTWKKNIPSSRKRIFLGVSSHSLSRYLSIVVVLAALLVLMYPNFITICSFVVFGIIVIFCQLYSSVIWALSVVVSVVEDRSSVEAVEKAEKLVKGGQRLHGFMLNVFFNLVALILSLPIFYFIDKWSENVTVYYYGLFFLNSLSLLKMSALMAYTVFYFRCKKHHGEDEDEEINLIIGDLQYTKLPVLSSDIP